MSEVSVVRNGSSPWRRGDGARALGDGLYQGRPCGTDRWILHGPSGRLLMLRLFVLILLLLGGRTKRCDGHHRCDGQDGKRIHRLPHVRHSPPTHIRFGSLP